MRGEVIVFPTKRPGIAKIPCTYRNLAAALMVMNFIPEGNALIAVLGRGNEYSNQRAIETWLMSQYSEHSIRNMRSPLDTVGDALIHFLNERLNLEGGLPC